PAVVANTSRRCPPGDATASPFQPPGIGIDESTWRVQVSPSSELQCVSAPPLAIANTCTLPLGNAIAHGTDATRLPPGSWVGPDQGPPSFEIQWFMPPPAAIAKTCDRLLVAAETGWPAGMLPPSAS